MKSSLALVISVAALSVAGCKKEPTPVPADTAAPYESATMAAPQALSPAQAFANAVAASDAFEIESSKLAVANAQSTKVKAFAGKMIEAHTASTAKLQTAASAATPAIIPDAALSASQQLALTDLRGKSGADFDAAYAKVQADAHQATLDTAKAYAAGGDMPSLKTFAAELVPIVTGHLNVAKGLP